MRLLAALMALGGIGRLVTRATVGPPHRFHDLLLLWNLARQSWWRRWAGQPGFREQSLNEARTPLREHFR